MTPPYFDEHRITPIIPHPHTDKEPCPGGCDDIVEVEEAACKMRKDIKGLEARIQDSHDQMTRFETRLGEGNDRMGRIEDSISTTASKVDHNSADTSEILEIIRDAKSFFKFARIAGNVLTWALGISTACAAFYLTINGLAK